MLADLLAAGLNANLGGRDHAPIEVERQVIAWAAEMLGFPADASGVLVTGSSMANLIGVLVARTASQGAAVRRTGISGLGLVAYASAAAHGCLPRALEFAGMGRDALRMIPFDDRGRMRVDLLRQCIAQDRARGLLPFLIAGTAGTVDTGAVDDLAALADVAAKEALWFHVDGAFGATAMPRRCARCWRESNAPIPSPSISTNGRRCRTMPAASLCATPPVRSKLSVRRLPICAASSAAWPAAASGRATLAPTSRAASAR
jgi:glutamate/tyrosine decarboxylase-like PLP-dependent enzyme